LSVLNRVSEQDSHITLRKYRGLTHASLCLTRVTKAEEREEHLNNAEMYNIEACTAADRYFDNPETNPDAARIAKSQVTLDQASVGIRRARIATKKSSLKRQYSNSEPDSALILAIDAFQTYEDLAAEYEDTCRSGADYDIRAQAFLGCGEVVQMLQGAYSGPTVASLGYENPEYYFNRALHNATKGNRLSGIESEAKDGLRRSLSRIMRLRANILTKSEVPVIETDS
jgi:hypothetical protein